MGAVGNGWIRLGDDAMNGPAYFQMNRMNSFRAMEDKKSVLTNRIGRDDTGEEIAWGIEIDLPSSTWTLVYETEAAMRKDLDALLREATGGSEEEYVGKMSKVW